MIPNAENREQFQLEQDKLLSTLLEWRFFNVWKEITASPYDDRSLFKDTNLELYITNKCNQKCEYCYLVKYPQLYPQEANNPKQILQNLKIFYNFMIKNNFHIPTVEFFSGEIWHTQLGYDIFDLTIEYLQKGLRVDRFLIASNCSFVNNSETLQRIQTYIDTFYKYNTMLVFSISVDGAIIDNYDRPRNNGTLYTDEFYDTLFAFAKYNTFYFHPMISPNNIHLWKENLDWWEQKHDYFNLDFNNVMTLEVRDDNWDDESIKKYIEWLDYAFEKMYKRTFNCDYKAFANTLLFLYPEIQNPLTGYFPFIVGLGEYNTQATCTVASHLTVRVGDLAICPCHRTAYNKYLYGHFIVENNEITGIKANNPSMAVKILLSNNQISMHGCDVCIYKECCLRGCFGSQLESTKDPFMPNNNVCKMFKQKFHFLFKKYKEIGVIDYLESIPAQHPCVQRIIKFLQLYYASQREGENELGTSR